MVRKSNSLRSDNLKMTEIFKWSIFGGKDVFLLSRNVCSQKFLFFIINWKGTTTRENSCQVLKFFFAFMFVNVYRRSKWSAITLLPSANTETFFTKDFFYKVIRQFQSFCRNEWFWFNIPTNNLCHPSTRGYHHLTSATNNSLGKEKIITPYYKCSFLALICTWFMWNSLVF